MNEGALVLAYHGCDASVRDSLVQGQLRQLTPSANRYDWLGHGAYFFEADWRRALRFAQSSAGQPDKLYTARPIVHAAVVGAVLCVSRWLDLTTQLGLDQYRQGWRELSVQKASAGQSMPGNGPTTKHSAMLLRQLDCSVINMIHAARERTGKLPFQAVRGAFQQGDPIAPGSEFRDASHLQIALRDPACVLGWFLPMEMEASTLSPDAHAKAVTDLADELLRRRQTKLRVRVATRPASMTDEEPPRSWRAALRLTNIPALSPY